MAFIIKTSGCCGTFQLNCSSIFFGIKATTSTLVAATLGIRYSIAVPITWLASAIGLVRN